MKHTRTVIAFVVGIAIAGSFGWVTTAEGGPPWARLDGNNAFTGTNIFSGYTEVQHATGPGEIGFQVTDNAAQEGVGLFADTHSNDGIAVWGNYVPNSGGGAGNAAIRGDSNSPDTPAGFFQKNLRGSTSGNAYGLAFVVSTIDNDLQPQDGWEVGAFVVDNYGNVEISGDVQLTGSDYANGDLYLAGAVVNTSSARFKDNIETLADPLELVEGMRGVSFDWKNSGRHDIGVVAEEVAQVAPELVRYEDSGEARGVDYAKISAILIEAVKAQQEQIEQLRSEVEALRQQ